MEKYHFAFVNAQAKPHAAKRSLAVCGREDGDSEALEAWKRSTPLSLFFGIFCSVHGLRFCDMLRETEKILGAIDVCLAGRVT